MEAEYSSETLVSVYQITDVITQKTAIFVVIAMRSSEYQALMQH